MEDEDRLKSFYSRVLVQKDDSDVMFFAATRGQFDTKGNRLRTYVDTNIDTANIVHRTFKVREIRFYVSKDEVKFREHLLQTGYFIFRVVDMDICVYPIHMMLNTSIYFKKVFDVPIVICPYENFMINLRMDTSYSKEIAVTCELIGNMTY